MIHTVWLTVLIVLILTLILVFGMCFTENYRQYIPKTLCILLIIGIIAIFTAILFTENSLSVDKYTTRHLLNDGTHNHQLPKYRKFIDERLAKISSQVLGNKITPIYVINNYLSPEECAELIKSNEGKYRKSPLTREIKDFRTSETSFFDHKASVQIDLENKILETMNSHKKFGETSQMQHYNPGNEFKPHYDWFNEKLDEYWYKKGQRTWTFMIYLNDVEEGGDTEFVKLGVKIKPKIGRAVCWGNMTADNKVDNYTMHAGRPVIKGEKHIITKWFKKENNDS
jgi:prolyl 4-hydroxylase